MVQQETAQPKNKTVPINKERDDRLKKERDDRLKKEQYARDHKQVRGIFRFHEVPGGKLTFVFKKYKGDSVLNYSLQDGEVYTLPLMVAKHLNKDCWYPVHDYMMDDMGKFTNTYRIGKKVRRCSFQSLEFVDTDDITPEGEATIYTAENIGR